MIPDYQDIDNKYIITYATEAEVEVISQQIFEKYGDIFTRLARRDRDENVVDQESHSNT